MTTFTHVFSGGYIAEARRHTNTDGSEGGIVAISATVASSAKISGSAEIGSGASIGSDASIGNGASIGAADWWISVGPQGSRGAMLTAVQRPEGLRWWVGCKLGITTDELRGLVAETHGDSNHADEYLHVIAFVEAHPGRLRCTARLRC